MAMFLKSRKKEPTQESQNDVVMVASSGSAARLNRRNIPLIIGREYKTRVQKRSFVIATGILVLLIVAAAFAPTVISLLTSGSQTKITLVNNAGPVAGQDMVQYLNNRLNTTFDKAGNPKPLAADAKAEYDFKTASAQDVISLRQEVRDGKIDALLIANRGSNGDLAFDYYTKDGQNSTNTVRISSVASELTLVDRLGRLGLSQQQAGSLFQPSQFKTTSTGDERSGRSSAESGASYFIALAGMTLLFSLIIQFGTAVAQGAVEEKSNRIMEIMINAATPFQLMIGKIIGIGLVGFTQVAIMAVVGGGAALAQTPLREALLPSSRNTGSSFDIGGLSLGLLGLIVVFFVLGFLLYATLYAAVGSLVSRQEDVQGALGPLTFFFVIGFYAGLFGLNVPEAPWLTVLSYIPFFSPMVVLARAGGGALAAWEIPVIIGIMILSILLFTWIASRIYRAGVLMYGQKPGLSKLFKLAFAK